MTKTDAINFKTENGIRAAVFPLILIVESGQAIEFNAFYLGRFSASDYLGITLDEGGIIMVTMLVTDSNDIRRPLEFSVLKSPPGFIGVGDYSDSFIRSNQETRDVLTT